MTPARAPSIRVATPADLPEIMRLWRQLEAVQGPVRMFPLPGDIAGEMERRFAEELASDEVRVFLAEDGGRVIGMVVARLSSNWGAAIVELSKAVVDEDARGAGIGRVLLDACARFAGEHGARFIEAKVFAGNVDGRRFWEREGFEPRYIAVARPVEP